jgi:hypothetical protein
LLPSDFDYDSEAAAIAECFLGEVGCGVAEADALRLEGGTAEMLRAWEQSRRFRRALKDARERGKENLRYDAQRAARRSDPFATPPRPGAPDLAAETYDPQNPPLGGLARWLRRLGILADRQAQPEPAASLGQRFIAEADLTPQQLVAIRLQAAAQRQPEPSRSIFTQKPAGWSGKGMADDGSTWAD